MPLTLIPRMVPKDADYLTAATFEVTVVKSEVGSLATGITPQTVAPDGTATVSAATIAAAFNDGTGAGKITGYNIDSSSHDGTVVYATMGRDGSISLEGVERGNTEIKVTAEDDISDTDDLVAKFTVKVRAEAVPPAVVPLPNAPTGLMSADMTAYNADDDGGMVKVSWADPFDTRITQWQYSYMMDADGADKWNTIYSGAARSATISGLTVGTEYTVKAGQSFRARPATPPRRR